VVGMEVEASSTSALGEPMEASSIGSPATRVSSFCYLQVELFSTTSARRAEARGLASLPPPM
jgi:hypothetical protein